MPVVSSHSGRSRVQTLKYLPRFHAPDGFTYFGASLCTDLFTPMRCAYLGAGFSAELASLISCAQFSSCFLGRSHARRHVPTRRCIISFFGVLCLVLRYKFHLQPLRLRLRQVCEEYFVPERSSPVFLNGSVKKRATSIALTTTPTSVRAQARYSYIFLAVDAVLVHVYDPLFHWFAPLVY